MIVSTPRIIRTAVVEMRSELFDGIQDFESVVPEAGAALGAAAGALDLLSPKVAAGLLSDVAAALPDSEPDSEAGALLLSA
jgi:hypothetical protein